MSHYGSDWSPLLPRDLDSAAYCSLVPGGRPNHCHSRSGQVGGGLMWEEEPCAWLEIKRTFADILSYTFVFVYMSLASCLSVRLSICLPACLPICLVCLSYHFVALCFFPSLPYKQIKQETSRCTLPNKMFWRIAFVTWITNESRFFILSVAGKLKFVFL